jgi:hypothetical protein
VGAPTSAERIQAVRDLAAGGKSDREVGEQLGLSKDAVAKIRRNHGIPAGKPIAVTSEVLSTIRSLASEGASDVEIGGTVGMSSAAVWGVRKRHGIEAGNPPDHHKHGTPSMYNSGCRCEACKTVQSDRARNLRARLQERLENRDGQIEHGLSGYNNWGCRCDTCTHANAVECSAYHASAQAQTLPAARNHRKEWTGPELEVAARDDLTIKEAAAMLGRSFAAVSKMRGRLKDEPKYISFAGIAEGDGGAGPGRPDEETTT